MHVPGNLEEWTYELIFELAELGRCEGERHDFKFNLPDTTNLTKTCCAFANSSGGFVVVGVKDRSGHFLVEGIESDSEIAKKFSDKVKAAPSIEYVGPRTLTIPGRSKLLYVFFVPQSAVRPHMPQVADQRLFWKRTPGGCEVMSYNEIQEQFVRFEERREKLKLLFIELMVNRENLEGFRSIEAGKYSLLTLDNSVLDRLLVDTYSVVQGELRLVQILITLRTHIRIANSKTQMFFTQMALPLDGQLQLAAKHNQFMKEKADFLLPLISEALDILQSRFGLKDPFPSASSSAA